MFLRCCVNVVLSHHSDLCEAFWAEGEIYTEKCEWSAMSRTFIAYEGHNHEPFQQPPLLIAVPSNMHNVHVSHASPPAVSGRSPAQLWYVFPN